MALLLLDMYTHLGFSPKVAQLLIKEQGLDSPERLRVLTDKNVNDICNVVRKPAGKNTNGTPNRVQQVSVIAQESLKLAIFLFHHRWRCTLNWEVTGVNKNTVHLMMKQKKLKDECKDPNMLPKINKSDMAGMMEAIKEYLRSRHGVTRAPLAYVIRKTITVQIYGDYPMYPFPDDEMIARMLHLPADKNQVTSEQGAQSVSQCMSEYKIDNRTVYDILDQICNDMDMYSYVKQHRSKRDGRGAFYAIHSRWLGPNHVSATA